MLDFVAGGLLGAVGAKERARIVARFVEVTNEVRAYNTQEELLTVADEVLRRAGRERLTVVECGAGKGASTAKLSLVVARAGGTLWVYDSFRGIPANEEVHENLDGRRVVFREGAFLGRLRSVQRTVARFGVPEVCRYDKGLFEDTLDAAPRPIDVALIDVDLVASTQTCLVRLAPRMRPGGVIFSQDGHLRATVDLLGDACFWRDEVGVEPPRIAGLGKRKLLRIDFGRGAA